MNDSIKVIKYSKENSYLKEDEYNLNNNAAHLKEYDSDLNDCECKNEGECERECECEREHEHEYDLKDEQLFSFKKYLNRENIFVTGPGGTGKTYLIKNIVKHAKKNFRNFKVCALTGCAAILLECGATTLHTFAGIGLANGEVNEIVERVTKSWPKRNKWKYIELLIIDEVSMLSMKILLVLDKIAKIIKKNQAPFGGIQLVFTGDFYQLPPVGNDNDDDSHKFCFEAPLWKEMFPSPIILKTIYRQKDNEYIKILNNIRIGKITNKSYKLLQECVNKKYTDDIIPALILPRRFDVDIINNRELEKLKGESIIFKFREVSIDEQKITSKDKRIYEQTSVSDRMREIEYLKENIMAKKVLELKVGALVMCIANIDMESKNQIVNGSQGIITEFSGGVPKVKFNNGEIRLIDRHVWGSDRIIGVAVSQIPLIHGWAITIHKAQGLSLDKAIIDLGSGIFECGQTYVALSRIKSLHGLYLKALDINKITTNRKVMQYYGDL